MRRHLIAALAGLAVLTLAVYVVPRMLITADYVRGEEVERLDRVADLVAQGLQLLVDQGVEFGPDSFTSLVAPGERLTLTAPGSEPLQFGEVKGSGELVTVERQVGEWSLVLSVSTEHIDDQVLAALTPVLYLTALALVVSVAVALVLAGRLVLPFEALAEYTGDVDLDDLRPAPRSALPEANTLADALDRGHQRVQDLLRRERHFSSNASHQLRTPLAALRLRLEDLGSWPEVTDPVRAELDDGLVEVDRLAGTIDDLLALARSGGMGAWSDVSVAEVLEDATRRWRDLFTQARRSLDVELPDGDVIVATSARSVGQVLNVVLENAFAHGSGQVRVSLRDDSDQVVISVADEGHFDAPAMPGRPGAGAAGEGIGLGLANVIADAIGARLVLASRAPTTFELRLPRL